MTACITAVAVAAPAAFATEDAGHGAPPPESSVERIIECAIERGRWIDEQDFAEQFEYDVVVNTDKLRRDGTVKQTEQRRYRVVRLDGEEYARLIEKDGEPLSGKDLREARKDEREFREKLRQRRARARAGTDDDEDEEDDDERFRFSDDLIEKYTGELVGLDEVQGRLCWVIAFAPKPNLTAKSRIDRALNKSAGHIWIDTLDFEVLRIEFELISEVRVWWGLLGKVTELYGTMERTEVEPEVWFPSRFDMTMDGRVLFRSLHQRRRIDWGRFDRRPVAASP